MEYVESEKDIGVYTASRPMEYVESEKDIGVVIDKLYSI